MSAESAADNPLPDVLGQRSALQHGIRLGNYTLRRRIGGGGMGVVYEADQDNPPRAVAVKILHNGILSESARERFVAESKHLGRLRHPNMAQIFESGTQRQELLSIPYYSMELVAGGSPITTYAHRENLSADARMRLFIGVCDAVQHAHEQGILHCDLKPANILVDTSGCVKVIDFGIARAADADQPGRTMYSDASGVLGTPQYMSPEQFTNEYGAVDVRSDLYSLGVVLYELLCAELPYQVETKNALRGARVITEFEPRLPRQANRLLSRDTERILLSCLEKSPDLRYGSVRELSQDLARVLEGEPVHAGQKRTLYRIASSLRRTARRHPLLSFGFVLMVASIVAYRGGFVLDRWKLCGWFETAAVTRVGHFPNAPFVNVRIIAIHEGTDLTALARLLGVHEYDPFSRKDGRGLHAALMQNLAKAGAGARVLAWDMHFPGSSRFDADFAAGVTALQNAGSPVVVGCKQWLSSTPGIELLSPRIGAAQVGVGGMTATLSDTWPWTLDLAWKSSESSVHPSVALLAASLCWFPPKPQIEIDALGLTVRSMLQDDHHQNSRRVDVSELAAVSPEALKVDPSKHPKNVVAEYVLELPEQPILDAATVDYAEVLAAGPEKLRQWFNGKAVIVGDARQGADGPFNHADGRRLPGFIAHAVALERLLAETPIRRPQLFGFLSAHVFSRFLAAGISALIGSLIGSRFSAQHGLRALCEFGLAGLIMICAFLAYRYFAYLHSPTTVVATLLGTSEFIAALRRLSGKSIGGHSRAL